MDICMYHPRQISLAIGDDVLAAFYRCFVGIDRILAFEHMLLQNRLDEAGGASSLPPGDPAYARNRILLSFLIAGTMDELGDALQQLCDTKFVLRLRDRASWTPLNELRKAWNKDAFASRIRNEFAHHLGDLDLFRMGIASSPDEAVLYKSGGVRVSSHSEEPWNALLRGAGMHDDVMRTFLEKTNDGRRVLPAQIFALFSEVLASAGIEVVEE